MRDSRILLEWVDANGNKTNTKNSTSTFNIPTPIPETGYKEKFKKLLNYHKQHVGSNVTFTEIIKLNNYGFEYKEQLLTTSGVSKHVIEVDINDDGEWYIYVWHDGFNVAANFGKGFEDLLKGLRKHLTIPVESSTEYQKLLEWVDANGNKAPTVKQASQQAIGSQSTEIVYIWDMYIDPRDKGTWCSAEEYNGEYDGSVFKTKEAAYNEAKIHLYELEDEGQLRGDPEDYDIDVIAIPKNKVSQRSLKISCLTESQTLKTLSSDNIKVKENGGRFEIYKDGKSYCTCDNLKEVKDELNELETNRNKYKVTWTVIEKDDKVNYKSEEVEAASEEDAINIIKDKNAFDKKAIKLEAVERSLAEEFKIYENLWDY